MATQTERAEARGPLMVVIWALTGRGTFWPGFIMATWGIGLALHAWRAFGQRPITEADVDRELERTHTHRA